ncbi:MAG: hypothetical protein Fur0016_23370 [Anaerolineales bacterium]
MTDIHHFIEWNRRQGHQILRTKSTYWVSAGMGTYQAVPYHAVISPSEEELQTLFREHRATALRYSTPLSAAEGMLSYHIVYEGKNYPPKKLPHKAKKGLAIAVVEPISLSQMATEGWQLRRDTLERQGRLGAEKQSWWKALCLTGQDIPGLEAWGAMVDGRLAAALLGMQCDDTFSIFFQQSHSDFLRLGVNNALTYVVTTKILERPEINRIFYGLHSLDAPPSVDEYKIHMGYFPKPVRQCIVFSPFLRPLVNPLSHAALKTALRLIPSSYVLAKAEGMFRFYLNGKQPLEQQSPPPLLAGYSMREESIKTSSDSKFEIANL